MTASLGPLQKRLYFTRAPWKKAMTFLLRPNLGSLSFEQWTILCYYWLVLFKGYNHFNRNKQYYVTNGW